VIKSVEAHEVSSSSHTPRIAHQSFIVVQVMAALRGKEWCQETLDAALVALLL
jgi:hypothetical protein